MGRANGSRSWPINAAGSMPTAITFVVVKSPLDLPSKFAPVGQERYIPRGRVPKRTDGVMDERAVRGAGAPQDVTFRRSVGTLAPSAEDGARHLQRPDRDPDA